MEWGEEVMEAPFAEAGADNPAPLFMEAVSIDPSLRSTGIVTRIRGVEYYQTVASGSSTGKWRAVQQILAAVGGEISRIDPEKRFAVVEQYAYGAKGNYLVTQGEIGGAIRYLLWRRRVPFVELAQNTWKAATMGKAFRHVKKTRPREYLAAVRAKYGRMFPSVDVADAWLMLKAAEMIAAGKTDFGEGAAERLREILGRRE